MSLLLAGTVSAGRTMATTMMIIAVLILSAVDNDIPGVARAQAVGETVMAADADGGTTTAEATAEVEAATATPFDADSSSGAAAAPWEGRRPAVVPGTRGLTIEEAVAMVMTETDEEMGWDASDEETAKLADDIWKAANSFEWSKAAEAEFVSGEKYPYLLCHVGASMSGNQRREALAEAIGYDSREEEEEQQQQQDGGGGGGTTYHLMPLYNERDFLCVYCQLPASVASGVTGSDFIVQPILPSLKYMKGSVDGMRQEVDFHNGDDDQYNPQLDIMLCPGVAMADPDDAEEGAVPLSEEMEAEIVQMLVPRTIASQLADAMYDTMKITESYYLTSRDYLDMAGDAESTLELTERSRMWRGMIEDYQESGMCTDTYSNRLGWTIQRASDPDTDISHLYVAFNTTGVNEQDTGCMLTLSFAIAAHPDVCAVESRRTVEVRNTVVQWLTQSEIEGRRPFFDSGLDGSGQVVAVSDTGCDRDNCYFFDPNVEPSSNFVNPAARKIAQYVDFVDNSDYEYGHGTHVAGTIAGRRIDGPGMADGVAPGAKIAFADIGDSNRALSLPLDRRLLNTGRPDAKIHSASWGSELNFYTTQSRNFDQYMYENDDFLIVVAAGNSGHGDTPNTVGSPATAKNIIAVGAHHNTGTSRPKHALGPSYIADFSSRGPTLDGRIKPDLMAPGKAVLSAGAKPFEFGECDPSNGKIPGANSKQDGLVSMQGTSMATPVVSGTAAIIRQYFQQGYYPTGVKTKANIVRNPSGALVKAVLMNGAQWLRGVDNGGNGVTEISPYDNNQGFGRLAPQYSVYIPGKTNVMLMAYDREVVNDQRSQSYSVTIDKSNGCAYDKLSVTLVWVEPGSTPGCTACVLNDLDLTVEHGGRTYYPNNLGRPDRRNNAERVIVAGVNHGDEAIITVEGYNLMRSSQNYALVATGCFGGVANQMFADQCSAFDCDDSGDKRTQTILMAIFIPVGVILLCCAGLWWRRRKQGEGNYSSDDGPYEENM